ncbi:rRNA-binding ribosome biosynthesis protein [Coemansia sp. RSA 2049]|nr:rRNA-binding ribosome biosynthesis protein [Coemansia sp. RSA 2049]
MGHGRKKRRTHVAPTQEDIEKTPKSLVVKSGNIGRTVAELVSDVRRVMQPNTAAKLRERKSNKIKDYVAVSSQLSLTHLMLFSQTETGTNLRIGRIPRGPTLYFRVNKYSLAKDCLRLQKTPHTSDAEYKTAPLIILNNFAGEGKGKELKLMTAMLQNMFPAINPSTMHLSEARRVVLFNYNDETDMVDFRHYTIVVKPVGITKGVKRVILSTNVPSLAGYSDISEYVLREAFASESDMEDGPESAVTLAQDYVGRGNRKNEQRAVRLLELGPRMELKLMKVEGGLCQGEVLFHSYLHKTKEELEKQARVRQIKLTQQARRRQEQESNVERKKGTKKGNSGDASDEDSAADDDNDDSESEAMSEDSTDRESKSRRAADDFGADDYEGDTTDDDNSEAGDDEEGGEGNGSDDDDNEPRSSSSSRPAKRARTSKSSNGSSGSVKSGSKRK